MAKIIFKANSRGIRQDGRIENAAHPRKNRGNSTIEANVKRVGPREALASPAEHKNADIMGFDMEALRASCARG